MKTKKRILTSLLLGLTMLLSACGGSSSRGGVSPGSGTASSDSADALGTAAAAFDDFSEEQIAPTNVPSGRLKMILNGTDVVYAELNDTPAAAEFLGKLPFSIDMHEHMDRQKEVYLPFSLSEECQTNTVYEYEIGDIVYWHPGPTMGIFTEHDGRSISSGIEV